MKRFAQSLAGLVLTCSMVGCCWRPGYVDHYSGVCYGGFWEPICGGPLDPFWWLSCLTPCWVPAYGCYGPGYDACCAPASAPACGCNVCCDPAIAPLSYAGPAAADCGCHAPGGLHSPTYLPGGPAPYIVPEGILPTVPHEQISPPPAPAASTSYHPVSSGPVMMQQATQTMPAATMPVRDARAQQWVPSRL